MLSRIQKDCESADMLAAYLKAKDELRFEITSLILHVANDYQQ